MLAATVGIPTAVSTGKVMRVPPPARAFTAPPTTAASPTRTNSRPLMIFLSFSLSFEAELTMARGPALEDLKRQEIIETLLCNYNYLSKSEQADRGCGAGAQEQQGQDQAGQAAPEARQPFFAARTWSTGCRFSGKVLPWRPRYPGHASGKGKAEFFAHAPSCGRTHRSRPYKK